MRTQTDMRYQFSAISRKLNHAAAANSRENICQPSRQNHARIHTAFQIAAHRHQPSQNVRLAEYPPPQRRSWHSHRPNIRTARPADASPAPSASAAQCDPRSADAWKTGARSPPRRTDWRSSSQPPTACRRSSPSASRCAAGNLAQRGSERFRILRQLGTVFVASYSRVREIAICISDAAIGARIVLSSTPSNPKPPDAESSRSSRERPPPKYMSE